MPNDKFILIRKQRQYNYQGKYPKVHVSAETYEQLADWAIQTDRPLSDIVGQAVRFAAEHAVFIDQ